MCMSPHEMTSTHIEEDIQMIESWLADPSLGKFERQVWEWRLEGFREILKERADNGTYHDDPRAARRG